MLVMKSSGAPRERRTRGRSPCVSRRMGGACEALVEPCAQGRPPLGAPTVALVFTREPAFADASAGKPAIAWRRWAPPSFRLPGCLGAWPAGARVPRGAVTSRCGGDATVLLRLRDRLRRRPSNEQN